MIVSINHVSDGAPLSRIGSIAGICYGADGGNPVKRASRCWDNGHMSVFEHVSVTWLVEGISRSCSHQLVRHRMASYTQVSQRYTKAVVDPARTDWYVTPPCFAGDGEYAGHMVDAASNYLDAIANGTRPEDARFLLPEATKTTVAVTMNLREFRHFYELRADSHAQWEIRELASAMLNTLPDSGEWLEFRRLLLKEYL